MHTEQHTPTHTEAFFVFLSLVLGPGERRLRAYKSTKSESERAAYQKQGPNYLGESLCSPRVRTQLLCTAFQESFHNTERSAPMKRLCVRAAADRLGRRRDVTPTRGTIPFSKTKAWDSDTLRLVSASSEFRNEDTPMRIREEEANYREWCYC